MPYSPEKRRAWEADNLRRAALTVEQYKLTQGCYDCGYRAHPAALHFDHRDPDTKRHDLGWRDDRTKLITHTRFAAYMHHVRTYCNVRCANCHAVRTSEAGHYTHRRPATLTTF
ncbi:hypothetical protein [Microbacterium thalli]|uniref:hypothetical protein n=1 Tax=Microbacterium thalli TaxID=3027921 RepID=UPI002366BA76|nr:hypothetical protein [Microbacterium thalli]MDD7930084.1 hypothetical protein [Microbacterium thalli]